MTCALGNYTTLQELVSAEAAPDDTMEIDSEVNQTVASEKPDEYPLPEPLMYTDNDWSGWSGGPAAGNASWEDLSRKGTPRTVGAGRADEDNAEKAIVSLDFRNGVLPPGVEVVGTDPEFITQQDGSTVLKLPALSHLKVWSCTLCILVILSDVICALTGRGGCISKYQRMWEQAAQPVYVDSRYLSGKTSRQPYFSVPSARYVCLSVC